MKKFFLHTLLFCAWLESPAQFFYTNTFNAVTLENKIYKVRLDNCSEVVDTICPPTNNVTEYFENMYTDIAQDHAGNLYFVSGWGSLYRKSGSSCTFLGSFGHNVNALTVSANGIVYGTGHESGICTLYKYDPTTGVFSSMGALNSGFFSAGDLFFYEDRLFMTGTNSDFSSSYLVEVNMSAPGSSCYYMHLDNYQPWAAFSHRSGSVSEAYIITSSPAHALRQLDMTAKTVGPPLCIFSYEVMGAAMYYDLTDGFMPCDFTTEVPAYVSQPFYFEASGNLNGAVHINTNIPHDQFKSLQLLDLSGRAVRQFGMTGNDLDVSGLPASVYLLQAVTNNQKVFTQKIVITW